MRAELEAPARTADSVATAGAVPNPRAGRGPGAGRGWFCATCRTLLPAAALAGLGLAPSALGIRAEDDLPEPIPAALASITTEEVEADVRYLASPALEGRDTPSRGLDLAMKHVAEAFAAAGLVPAPDSDAVWRRVAGEAPPPDWAVHRASGGAGAGATGPAESSGTRAIWLRPYLREKLLLDRVVLYTPVPEQCALELTVGTEAPRALRYGVDFVPLSEHTGEASGELAFAGFGIENADERYDDFRGLDVTGKVVALVAGEPDHKRLFGGVDVTAEASVWNKIDEVAGRGAVGAIVIRRPPALAKGEAAPELSYRWTRATWLAPTNDKVRSTLPAVELHWSAAEALLGFDPLEWAAKVDRSGKSTKREVEGRKVRLCSATRTGPVVLANVVGYLPGRDGALATESIVIGAHVDHIGVGPRERVGPGADDNASGTAAMMEVAEALALAKPARGVWCVGFSAEEDGLIGSAAFVADLPMPREQLVAMVNLDMVGRGDPKHVVTLGFRPNPGLRDVVARAERLGNTGVKRVEECSDVGLFQRSDHYSFHAAGIPAVFFFENFPIESNRDYHSWRDVADLVDFEKVRNTARLAFHTAWVLAEDRARLEPPKPQK